MLQRPDRPQRLDPRDRLIVALDFSSVEEARAMVTRLGDTVSFYKIGYQLGFADGIGFSRELIDGGKQLFIDLKPERDWRPGMTKRKVIDEMDHLLDTIPGTDASFSQPIRDNVLESISQVDGQIVIKVFGEDPVVLREQAEKTHEAIRDVNGVERSFIDRLGELPQVQIQIDRERAARCIAAAANRARSLRTLPFASRGIVRRLAAGAIPVDHASRFIARARALSR